jgi:hypothetical protein
MQWLLFAPFKITERHGRARIQSVVLPQAKRMSGDDPDRFQLRVSAKQRGLQGVLPKGSTCSRLACKGPHTFG